MSDYSKQALIDALSESFDADRLLKDEPMSLYTTFELGGMADCMIEPESVAEIVLAIEAAERSGSPYWIIGCGSDLLISDAGLRGLVIHLGDNFSKIEVDGETIFAQAGATNQEIAQVAYENSLTGYEFASGIPGSVGGAAIMNAGAYDGEFKNVAESVLCLDKDMNVVSISNEEANWGYRKSKMADEGLVVLEAVIKLKRGDKKAIADTMAELKEKRESKQPLEHPSAGSTFKRPEGYFAGKLIDDSGMRGHRRGGASVSTKHAGFVVNDLNGTAADVLAVIEDVQAAVFEKFGVELEPEVKMLGFEPDNVYVAPVCKTHSHLKLDL